MISSDSSVRRWSQLTLTFDVGVRAGALVVVGALLQDLWGEVTDRQPNTDGLAPLLFVALLAYVAWSVFLLVDVRRRWRHGLVDNPALIALVGCLSIVRLIVLRAISDENTSSAHSSLVLGQGFLRLLVVASAICAVIAGIALIDLARTTRRRTTHSS